ncbi:MAG: hypothetical protein ACL7BU_06455 [Candidatus Phlomobacter fragariae]
MTEQELLSELCKVDLLIFDEIGVQHQHSENTQLIINQFVDILSRLKGEVFC